MSALRDAIDVLRTFSNFASCLTEVLSSGSKNGVLPEATVHSGPGAERVLSTAGGAIMATAHTAGWESLGALLARDQHDASADRDAALNGMRTQASSRTP